MWKMAALMVRRSKIAEPSLREELPRRGPNMCKTVAAARNKPGFCQPTEIRRLPFPQLVFLIPMDKFSCGSNMEILLNEFQFSFSDSTQIFQISSSPSLATTEPRL